MGRLYKYYGNEYDYRNSSNVPAAQRSGKPVACVGCGKKSMIPFINIHTGELLDNAGKCNRASKCDYLYTPIQYFEQHGKPDDYKPQQYNPRPLQNKPAPAPVSIPTDIVELSRKSFDRNVFYHYLLTLFDTDTVTELMDMYLVGSSNSIYKGGTVFYFIDVNGAVWFGQVKLFRNDGHTDSVTEVDKETGETTTRKCTTAIHAALFKSYKDRGVKPQAWVFEYAKQPEKVRCLFGEHLLTLPENKYKPVAVVESPKTAIICAGLFKEYVWLSAGALGWLSVKKCQCLKGRRVVFYPDLSQNRTEKGKEIKTAFEQWQEISNGIKDIADSECSDILETFATDEQRAAGADLADILESYALQLKRESEAAKMSEQRESIMQKFEAALVELVDTGAGDDEIKDIWYSYWNNHKVLQPKDLPLIIAKVLKSKGYNVNSKVA